MEEVSAFGLNRFTTAFAVAVNDAGTRLNERQAAATDFLAWKLFEWGGGKDLDTTFAFLYPFVGGTAVSHSFNLADPNTGRIEWVDTVTHSGLGIIGDGASGHGKTGVTLAGGAQADAFITCGVYSRTANAGAFCEIGNYSTENAKGIIIYCRHTTGPIYYNGSNTSVLQPTGVANSQGLFTLLRAHAASFWCYKTGVGLLSTAVANPAIDPPVPFLILARPETNAEDDTGTQFSNRNLAFAFLTNKVGTPEIGPIFTTPKQAELYSHVQSFQTKLGRQV